MILLFCFDAQKTFKLLLCLKQHSIIVSGLFDEYKIQGGGGASIIMTPSFWIV